METMLDYINEEEATLQNILADFSLKKVSGYEKINNLLILATGSSYNACLAAKVTLEKFADIAITIEEPYNFNHYGRISNSVDAVLAVSQSGKSASTIDAIAKLKKEGLFTLALTSDVSSPIAAVVDEVIDLEMGIEKVGFVTKGYVSSVLQLFLLGLTIGYNKQTLSQRQLDYYQRELKKVIAAIPDTIEKTNNFFTVHEAIFKLGTRFIAIGYGPNWGTAKEFETKFTETVRKPSQGFELEAYMHGPYLEADSEHILFFIETKSVNEARSQSLKNYMNPYVGTTITVTTANTKNETELGLAIECDELISSLLLVIPFQILAYKIATAKGIDLSQRIFDDFDQVLKSKV